MSVELHDFAPAKVNLTLRVLGRRPDGYHDLDSLVVFAEEGDHLTLRPGGDLSLDVSGPTAPASGPLDDNLVLKAVRRLAAQVPGLKLGAFRLDKRLPVAAGIGGGSSDAAAALRLVARANDLALADPRVMEAARATGADVPVCLDPKPRVMRGTGDILSEPLDLPLLPAVLVNPGVAVPTKNVFQALTIVQDTGAPSIVDPRDGQGARPALSVAALIGLLTEDRNDLEAPAIRIQPIVAEVLAALRATGSCRLARMSGSGATCFAIYDTPAAASAARDALSRVYQQWWTCATLLGNGKRA